MRRVSGADRGAGNATGAVDTSAGAESASNDQTGAVVVGRASAGSIPARSLAGLPAPWVHAALERGLARGLPGRQFGARV